MHLGRHWNKAPPAAHQEPINHIACNIHPDATNSYKALSKCDFLAGSQAMPPE